MRSTYRQSVPTVQSLTRTRRWLDRRQVKVAAVITAMRQGATLDVQFDHNGHRWRLSTGAIVVGDIAAIVRSDSHVVGVGDTLFEDTTSQTFRYLE
jgi:hypothetical protein